MMKRNIKRKQQALTGSEEEDWEDDGRCEMRLRKQRLWLINFRG